jgi:hypothetical protein
MATRQGVSRKTPKERGRPFWASSDERVDCEARSSVDFTLYSPALRVGVGKSGAGGGECSDE